MTLDSLKWLRLIVPGIIFLCLALPLLAQSLTPEWLRSQLTLQSIYYLLPSFVVGVLYYISNIRSLFVRKSLTEINSNIKERLLRPCLDVPMLAKKQSQLREGQLLINIFYRFVDSDDSLKARASNVRFNGIVWTSIADSEAMALVFLIIYPIGFVFVRREHYLWIGGLCLVWALLCHFFFMPAATRRHIKLSNYQLDYIIQNSREKLCARIADAARGLR